MALPLPGTAFPLARTPAPPAGIAVPFAGATFPAAGMALPPLETEPRGAAADGLPPDDGAPAIPGAGPAAPVAEMLMVWVFPMSPGGQSWLVPGLPR
jgi:hypothetical protein